MSLLDSGERTSLRQLVWLSVAGTCSVEVRRHAQGHNEIWLGEPVKCDAEWGISAGIAGLLGDLAEAPTECRTAQVIDQDNKNQGSVYIVIYSTSSAFKLTDAQVMCAVSAYLDILVGQRTLLDAHSDTPSPSDVKRIESHSSDFLKKVGGKPVLRPVKVGVGEKVLAHLQGRWADGPKDQHPKIEKFTALLRFDGFQFSKRVIYLRSKKRGFEMYFDQEQLQPRLSQLANDLQAIYRVVAERRCIEGRETFHLQEIELAEDDELATELERVDQE